MTFAVPLFLAAAAAALIPLILHLINRQRAKDLTFSTLRFLKISVQKTRRRKRFHDLLLMLLRMAVLLLIAFGLARPTLTTLRSLLGGGALSSVAIILDNSASMGVIDSGKTRLETALAAAEQILREVAEGDEVALWLTCGPPLPDLGHFDPQHDKIKQILAQMESQGSASYERANLVVALDQARKLLADSKATNKQIYVLTDMQEVSWEGVKKEAGSRQPAAGSEKQAAGGEPKAPGGEQAAAGGGPAGPAAADAAESAAIAAKARYIPIIVVDCNRAPATNLAISAVDVEAVVPVAGLPVKAVIEVFNPSTVEDQRVVELYVDGVKEGASPSLAVKPGERKRHEFLFTFNSGGIHRGEVRLSGTDGCRLDDRRFFTMEVDQGIPVAIVVGQRHEIPYLDDAFYLEKALSPSSTGGVAIRTQVIKAGDLLTEPLSAFTAIYCVNLPAPEPDAAARLRTYVEEGGNLFWVCGENVQPDAYNRMNDQAQKSLLPAPLLEIRSAGASAGRDTWQVRFLDRSHRALRHLAEPASLYESILVDKHVRVDMKSAPDAKMLLGLDDGEALLVQRKVQRGTVTMLTTSAHKNWTNLPLRPIFVPMLALMTFEMAGVERQQRSVLAGAPLVLQFDEQSRPSGVEILTPDGARIQKENRDEKGNLAQTFRYPDSHEVGVYTLNLMGGPRPKAAAFAVNLDPDELNPAVLAHSALEESLRPTPVVFAEDPDDLTSTFKWLREGRGLWEWFLSAVLVFLVFETFVSNWLSPEPENEQLHKIPPGMRRLARRGRPTAA
jgi:hypothetical protein